MTFAFWPCPQGLQICVLIPVEMTFHSNNLGVAGMVACKNKYIKKTPGWFSPVAASADTIEPTHPWVQSSANKTVSSQLCNQTKNADRQQNSCVKSTRAVSLKIEQQWSDQLIRRGSMGDSGMGWSGWGSRVAICILPVDHVRAWTSLLCIALHRISVTAESTYRHLEASAVYSFNKHKS